MTNLQKAIIGSVMLTAFITGTFFAFKVMQLLYLIVVASTLLAGLTKLGVPSLGHFQSGFFVPSATGVWLSIFLLWLFITFLLLNILPSER